MSDQLVYPVVPFQGFREIDDFGGGGFGAPRRKTCPVCYGKRCETCKEKGYIVYPHEGLDVTGKEYDKVVMPHTARIAHVGIAYPGSDLGSLHLHSADYRSRLLYAGISCNLTKGMTLTQGERLGSVQNVAAYHEAKSPRKRMTNHVHMDFWIKKGDVWVRTDPTPYFAAAGTV